MNRQQRRAGVTVQRVPALISQRLEVALGAEAPRTSLRSAAWQSAMRKLWAMEREAKREAT